MLPKGAKGMNTHIFSKKQKTCIDKREYKTSEKHAGPRPPAKKLRQLKNNRGEESKPNKLHKTP